VPGGGRTANVLAEELGVGLVILGILMMLGAIWHYLDVAKAIDEDTYGPSRLKIVATSLAVVVLGGASLAWLLW